MRQKWSFWHSPLSGQIHWKFWCHKPLAKPRLILPRFRRSRKEPRFAPNQCRGQRFRAVLDCSAATPIGTVRTVVKDGSLQTRLLYTFPIAFPMMLAFVERTIFPIHCCDAISSGTNRTHQKPHSGAAKFWGYKRVGTLFSDKYG